MSEATVTKQELYADGWGNWHAVIRAQAAPVDLTAWQSDYARIEAARKLAESTARKAILDALAEREQTTGETIGHARAVIRAYLKREPLVMERIDYNGDVVTVVYGERLPASE